MTRETKIGLLVGLAFIIVIGVLLSDHFASTMQPPPAQLVTATDSVFKGTATPGAKQGATNDVKIDVQPKKKVEIGTPPKDDKSLVVVGPGGIGKKADAVKEPVVKDDPGNTTKARDDKGAADHNDAPQTMREYTAEPGDTLSKIATKLLGKNTKANRDAIMKANPELKDPNQISSGKTYLIPGKAPEGTGPGNESRTETRVVMGPATRPTGAEVVYTTRKGDSLWKIATEQVGTANAVQQIRDLNKDVLKNGDSIKPDTKLRLPPKQVASTN